jgi:hypothetical protein
MSDNQELNNPGNDLKASFAWGQLFASAPISGLAVWKLLHKMTNTEPSLWFAGLSARYLEVRDFVLQPLAWLHLNLPDHGKDVLTISLIVAASFIRVSAIRYMAAVSLALGVFGFGLTTTLVTRWNDPSFNEPLAVAIAQGVLVGLIWSAGMMLVMFPIWALMIASMIARGLPIPTKAGRELESGVRLAFWNVVMTILCGVALLLVDWASP